MQPNLVNTGPFWDKYPDVYPGVLRYTDTDRKGNLVECWERNAEGVMVDVTARELARIELTRAQEELDRYEDDDEEDYYE